jgi:lambda family phage portal protein
MVADKTTYGENIVHGVRLNAKGAALSYFFRSNSDYDYTKAQEIEIKRRDRFGRPVISHCFLGDMGQIRGIALLAPVVATARQFDRLQDATMATTVLQTLYAATFKSELPSADVLQALTTTDEAGMSKTGLEVWMELQTKTAGNVDINLGNHAKIPHLLPGEEFEFKTPGNPTDNYMTFAKFLLREVGWALGLSYSGGTGDYSDSTYASLQVDGARGYELHKSIRSRAVEPMCTDFFHAWLEEDIYRGNTVFPGGRAGFLANKFDAFEVEWKGPGKPVADDLKTARANEVLDSVGVKSQTTIAEEYELEIEDEYRKRSREQVLRKKLGLRDPVKQRVLEADEMAEIEDKKASRPAQPALQ